MTGIVNDLTLDDIKVGDSSYFDHKISEEDQVGFSKISGDYNPLHLDSTYAKEVNMTDRVVYGMYLGALVSRLIGMHLPGKRSLIINTQLSFHKPAYIGDNLRVTGRIVHKSMATRIVEVAITVAKNTEILSDGRVNVRVLK